MHEPVGGTVATEDWREPCLRMVDRQIALRGVRDERVLRAMRSVPRHVFVAPEQRSHAYGDHPLPIGQGQTISQPYIVARMAEAATLTADDRVLEVGTGSGYGAAVLSRLCGALVSVERHEGLARAARARLAKLRYDNVLVEHGDASRGWPSYAPYDAIVVTAAAERLSDALVEQLAPFGRLVIPVSGSMVEGAQDLLRIERTAGGLRSESLGPVRFVPLVSG